MGQASEMTVRGWSRLLSVFKLHYHSHYLATTNDIRITEHFMCCSYTDLECVN
jgi:hypothetical protein